MGVQGSAVCPSGSFTNPLPPAVLQYNPSMTDETLDATSATGYTSPGAPWNIDSNGGFTIVMKFRIASNSDNWGALMQIVDPTSPGTDYIRINRNGVNAMLILENAVSGSDACKSAYPHHPISYNTDYTLVYLYDKSATTLGFYLSDSSVFVKTCPPVVDGAGGQAPCEVTCSQFIDYTSLVARIGSRYGSEDANAVAGKVYGVYAYDEALSDAQIQAVIDSIVVGGEDDARVLHGGACTACGAGLTTLAPGAISSNACVCQAGKYSKPELTEAITISRAQTNCAATHTHVPQGHYTSGAPACYFEHLLHSEYSMVEVTFGISCEVGNPCGPVFLQLDDGTGVFADVAQTSSGGVTELVKKTFSYRAGSKIRIEERTSIIHPSVQFRYFFACEACPAGSTTLSAGAESAAACVCQVGSYNDGLQNFARKCGATQDQNCPAISSSPAYWGEGLAPAKINDGDVNTYWHSGGEEGPLYLRIDLERVVNMQYVRITPRQEGHQGRLAGLKVRVGDNPDAYANVVCGDVGSWSDGDADGRDISCVASGRYMFLTDGPADKTTNVAELEAWGSVCTRCPAGSTTLAAGAESAAACVCQAGRFSAPTVSLQHLRAESSHKVYDRSLGASQYTVFPAFTVNFGTGFTILVRFKFSGTALGYERIVDFGMGSDNQQNGIILSRQEGNTLWARVRNPSGTFYSTTKFTTAQDTTYDVVVQYDGTSTSDNLQLIVNSGSPLTATATGLATGDLTFTSNRLAHSNWGSGVPAEAFTGTIYSFAFYDRLLSADERRAYFEVVLDQGVDSVCEKCPAGSTTLAAGAESADACVCQAGSFTNSEYISGIIEQFTFDNTVTGVFLGGTMTGTVAGYEWNAARSSHVLAKTQLVLDSSKIAATVDADEWTISTWVQFNDLSNDQIIIERRQKHNDPTKRGGFFIDYDFVDANTKKIRFYRLKTSSSSSYTSISSTIAGMATDKWYHVLAVCSRPDSTTYKMELFVNGVNKGSATNTVGWNPISYASDKIGIGEQCWTSSAANCGTLSNIDHKMDDLRFFDRALDSADISKLYNSAGALSCISCSPGQTTLSLGADSAAACVCQAGSHKMRDVNVARACGASNDQACPVSVDTEHTGHENSASKLNDGDTSAESYWHAGYAYNAEQIFAQIDLQVSTNVQSVHLWSREGLPARIQYVQIRVGNDNVAHNNPICATNSVWESGVREKIFTCVASGRYLFLTWTDITERYKNVGEIEIYTENCMKCPVGSTTLAAGAESADACVCQAAFYGSPGTLPGYADDNFESYGAQSLSNIGANVYDHTLSNGFKVRLSGWTYTRDYARGFLLNQAGSAYAEVYNLKPGHPYQYAIVCSATLDSYKHNVEFNVNGGSNIIVYQGDTTSPSHVGKAFANADGTILFTFFYPGTDKHVQLSGLSIASICQSCPAGSTTLAAGAESADACVCQAGAWAPFTPADAVVAFNPANEAFGASRYHEFGALNFNIATNGFTAVVKFYMKSNSVATHNRIFDFAGRDGTDGSSPDYNIILMRSGNSEALAFEMFNSQGWSAQCTVVSAITYDQWHSVYARYLPSRGVYLTIDDNPTVSDVSDVCKTQVDRTLSTNYIAKSWFTADAQSSVDVAGLYTFNRYLSDAEAKAVLATIQTGALDDPLHTACARCPAGQTTLSANALQLSECVCESGSFTAAPRVAFNPSGGYKDFPGTAGNYYPGSTDASNNAVSGTDYVNLGPLDLQIASHGGFTAVGKFKPHTSNRAYERVFEFADAYYTDQNIGISVLRDGTSASFRQTMSLKGVFCSSAVVSISANAENSFIMRYDAKTSILYPTFNGVDGASVTCTFSLPDLLNLPLNFIAAPIWNDAYFDGEIFGVYAYDHFLTKAEAQAILDGIKTGTDNTVGLTLENYCERCPAGQTTLAAGAESADACVCQAGGYSNSITYDFDKSVISTLAQWKEFADTIPGSSYDVDSWDNDGIWKDSENVGYLQFPIPSYYTSATVTFGNVVDLGGTVSVCVCSSAPSSCSDAGCGSQQDAGSGVGTLTRTFDVVPGQYLRVEETGIAEIKRDIVIVLSGCARCPAGQTTLSAGASHLSECVCESGSHLQKYQHYKISNKESTTLRVIIDEIELYENTDCTGPIALSDVSFADSGDIGWASTTTSPNGVFECAVDGNTNGYDTPSTGCGTSLTSGCDCSWDTHCTTCAAGDVWVQMTFAAPRQVLCIKSLGTFAWEGSSTADATKGGIHVEGSHDGSTWTTVHKTTDKNIASWDACTSCPPTAPYTDPDRGATSAGECKAAPAGCGVVDVTSDRKMIYEKTTHQNLGSTDDNWAGYLSWVSSHAGYTVPTVSQMDEFVATTEFADLITASATDPGGDHALTTDEWTPVYGDDGATKRWYQVGSNSRGATVGFDANTDTTYTGWYFATFLPSDVTSGMVKVASFHTSSSPYTLTFSAPTMADVLVISGSEYRYVTSLPVSGAYTITVSSTGESSFLGANSFGVTSGGGSNLLNDGVTSGLIAHWKFDGDYAAAAGSYTLTTTGTEFVDGYFGQGIYVDSTDTVYTTSNFVVGPTSQNTFSFWVKKGRNDANDFLLYISADVAAKARKEIGMLFDSNNKINFYIHSAGDLITTTEYTDLTTWMHIVAVLDNEDQKIYVNAQLAASQALDNKLDDITDSPLRNSRPGNPNQLHYDDFRVYNRVLTDAEITALYQAGARSAITGTMTTYTAPQVVVQFHAIVCSSSSDGCTTVTPTTNPAVSAVAVAGVGAENYLVFESNGARYWRISNAGQITKRPEISEIRLYSDVSCTTEIDLGAVVKTSHTAYSGNPLSNAFDGDTSTTYRPSNVVSGNGNDYPAYSIWFVFEFESPNAVPCVQTEGYASITDYGGLGYSDKTHVPGGTDAHAWNGGILLEASGDGSTWVTVAGPETGSNNVVATGGVGVHTAAFPSAHTVAFPSATTGEALLVSGSTYTHISGLDLSSGPYTVTVGADASVVTDAAGAVVATSAGGTEYQLPRWVLGAGGATCDDTCANVNMACDSATQTEVDTQDEVDNIAAELGITCTHFYGRSYAGVPFINEQNQCYYVDLGHTWSGGPPKISASVCHDNAQTSYSELFAATTIHRPVCRCVPATTGFENAITGTPTAYGTPQVILRYNTKVCPTTDTGGPSCPTDGTFVSGCPCPAETHFGSPGAVVAFNPSSASEESFTRVALNSKNAGETSWPLQTSSGFTLITKFKFTGTGAWFENVAYFGNAAQIGNIWMRRYGSGSEESLDFRIYQGSSGISTDSKCTIQSAAGSAPQNTVLNIIARWDGSVIELDINGVKASADCSLVMQNRVLSETYIGSSFIDTSIGGFVDSSRFLLGDMYGMYAWSRHLSDSETAQVLAGIEIGGPDTLPTLQCCAADGTYTPECGCDESTFQNTDIPINDRVISFNPAGGVRTFASASDYEDFGSSNSFAIKTNGGMTLLMKFRIHSGMPTSGQYPSIFSFKEGAGTGQDSNIYLNLANTMYFTVMKETGTTYGTDACGMSSFVRPTVNEWTDLIIVYDRTAESISISFSHIDSGTPASAACTVDLEDRIGTFRLNDNLYGSTEGTGFLGDVAGFYAYDRVLSSAEIDTILSGIKTDALNEDTITVCSACPTDGTYVAECGCPKDRFLNSDKTECSPCPSGKLAPKNSTSPDACKAPAARVRFSMSLGGSITASQITEAVKTVYVDRIAARLEIPASRIRIVSVQDARRRLLAVSLQVEIDAVDDDDTSALQASQDAVAEEIQNGSTASGLDATVQGTTSSVEDVTNAPSTCCFRTWPDA